VRSPAILIAGACLATVAEPASAYTHIYVGSKSCSSTWWTSNPKYNAHTNASAGDTQHSMYNDNNQWRGGYWAHWQWPEAHDTNAGTKGAHDIYVSAYGILTYQTWCL
jgi:hypothetical protein